MTGVRVPEEGRIQQLERDLPGFSIRAALHRMMGNIDLYCLLLRNFAEDRADAPETVMELLDGDIHRLYQYVHGLKGEAGNLGIGAVHEAAAAVVTACRNGSRDQLPALSRALGDSCRKAVALLSAIRPSSLAGEGVAAGDDSAPAFQAEWVLPLLKQLESLLESNHFRACEVAGEASVLFAGTGFDGEFHEIVRFIQDLRFSIALKKLRILMEKVMGS